MYHAIAWLGYKAVVPNVSVVTGGLLVPGPIPTHRTWMVGGKGIIIMMMIIMMMTTISSTTTLR